MPIVDVSREDWRLSPVELTRAMAQTARDTLRLARARSRFWKRPYGEDEAGPPTPLEMLDGAPEASL